MGIKYCNKTRRQFLVGSGKTLLALPVLPSLLPKEAMAQAAQVAPRRLMLFNFDHNNLHRLVPDTRLATNAVGPDGSREISLTQLGAVTSHSPTLNNARYESLKNSNQLTIMRGFDLSFGGAHGAGVLHAGQERESTVGNYPTMDTVLEVCPSVYSSNTPISVRRALRVAPNSGHNFFYRKIGNTVERVPHYDYWEGVSRFYNEVFSSLTGGTAPPQDFTNQLKSNILNRVYESFQGFRSGAKISANDRARLDQHMDYISDLQRSYASVVPQQGSSCVRPTDPGNVPDDQQLTVNRIFMDFLAVAFRCGLTKVGVFNFEGHDPQWIPGLNTQGHGFHAVMHGDHGINLQYSQKLHWWRFWTDMIAERFIAPLSEMEGDTGRSYLDNMITVLGCTGGFAYGNDGGHNAADSNHILLGSMAGRFRAGRYFTAPRQRHARDENDTWIGGNVPYNRFLLTLFELMGVPQSEYAFATANGRGFGYYGGFANYPLSNRFYDPMWEMINT